MPGRERERDRGNFPPHHSPGERKRERERGSRYAIVLHRLVWESRTPRYEEKTPPLSKLGHVPVLPPMRFSELRTIVTCLNLLLSLHTGEARCGGNRRPQPDWWDDECYDQLVSRNAAWRRWRRERTASAHVAFRQKRLQFHHVVRRKKSCFWSSWLSSQERLSRSNPRLAARDVHEQLGTNQRTLPRSMRCPASGRQVEGNDCLDAWRDHFRAAQPMPPVQGSARVDPTSSEITDRVAALRRVMLTLSGQLDLPFTEAALQNVLSQLPLHRAAGPDGLPFEVSLWMTTVCGPPCSPSLTWCDIGLLSLQFGVQLECALCTRVAL